jgi:hypothetical protein
MAGARRSRGSRKGKPALRWTRLPCRAFRDKAVRLQLFALAYNLANFLRSLALPDPVAHWFLTTLREKLGRVERLVGIERRGSCWSWLVGSGGEVKPGRGLGEALPAIDLAQGDLT